MLEPPTRAEIDAALRSPDPEQRRELARRLAASNDDAEPLLILVGDRDWRVRKTAVDTLVSRADGPSIRGLVQALADDENAGRRNSSTEALTRIGLKALPYLIEEFRTTTDVDVRIAVANLLGEIRSEEGFGELLAMLERESDVNVLSSIVSSLGRYRRAESLPQLLTLLKREDPWLRYHVVEALGEVGEPDALPAIVELWGDPSLRKPILDAVGSIADVGTASFLLSVSVENGRPNLSALRALIRIYDADKPRLIRDREREVIRRKFAEGFPRHDLPILVEQARRTPKREVREFLIRLLGWSRKPEVLPELASFLASVDTVDVAAQALVDFGPDALVEVVRLFDSEDEEVILSAVRVASEIATPILMEPLVRLLDNESSIVRRSSVDALAAIGHVGAAPYLMACFDDEDPGVQNAAVDALTRILSKADAATQAGPVQQLRQLLKSASLQVRLGALSVYSELRAEGASDELLTAAKDSDELIRRRAVSLMGRFVDERFGDALIHALADEDTSVRLAAIDALERIHSPDGVRSLLFALEDEDLWIRSAAGRVLGGYQAVEAIPPLLRHLESDLPPMKIACLEGLGGIRDPSASAAVMTWMDNEDPEIAKAAVSALARLPGEAVMARLLATLESPDWRLRAAAVSALALRGERRALPPLHRLLLDDPDDFVRSTVVGALEKIGDKSSFPFLLGALACRPILDDVCELLVRRAADYQPMLEEEWRRADRRREAVIAAILQEVARRQVPS